MREEEERRRRGTESVQPTMKKVSTNMSICQRINSLRVYVIKCIVLTAMKKKRVEKVSTNLNMSTCQVGTWSHGPTLSHSDSCAAPPPRRPAAAAASQSGRRDAGRRALANVDSEGPGGGTGPARGPLSGAQPARKRAHS